MGIERGGTEIYKGFFRKENQDKYFIPSRITFFGKHISNDIILYCAGVLSIVFVITLLSVEVNVTDFIEFFSVSLLAGLACAVGGAYKDAPFEGFKLLSFFRSPFILALTSPLFYRFGSVPLGFLVFINWGLERFIVEYYKTYIQRNRSGKFKREIQRLQEFTDSRQKYHYIALLIILGFFILIFHEFRYP
jgi:hypothetical protein